jgi:hypothetical protein
MRGRNLGLYRLPTDAAAMAEARMIEDARRPVEDKRQDDLPRDDLRQVETVDPDSDGIGRMAPATRHIWGRWRKSWALPGKRQKDRPQSMR